MAKTSKARMQSEAKMITGRECKAKWSIWSDMVGFGGLM